MISSPHRAEKSLACTLPAGLVKSELEAQTGLQILQTGVGQVSTNCRIRQSPHRSDSVHKRGGKNKNLKRVESSLGSPAFVSPCSPSLCSSHFGQQMAKWRFPEGPFLKLYHPFHVDISFFLFLPLELVQCGFGRKLYALLPVTFIPLPVTALSLEVA